MSTLPVRTAFIGFGEAAMAFAEEWGPSTSAAVAAYDIKTDDPATEAAKRADYARLGVRGASNLGEAIGEADVVISVVTADQALNAASNAAATIKAGALYCDFNSVAPATTRAAAEAIEHAGGRYVDVAVMAPVHPARLSVSLLVSGPHAAESKRMLESIGFRPRAVAGPVGHASAIKMLRSIVIKGMEALTAECFVAAHAAGLVDEVATSLGSSWPGIDWTERANKSLERMMVHGVRRAAEMEEVVKTLADLGLDPLMAHATAEKQRWIGGLAFPVPDSLDAKSDLLLGQKAEAA